MSKKKIVIGTVCGIGALVIGLGSVTAYNIEQDKQEQIRIEQVEKKKAEERKELAKKKAEEEAKEQERIAKEKEEKAKAEAELKRKQEEEKKKAEEAKAAQEEADRIAAEQAEAERLAAEQAAAELAAQQAAEELAAQQAEQQKIAEENNVQENYASNEEIVQDNGTAAVASAQTSSSYEEFMVAGVINSGGYKYTYYSQSVLPGGGLNIPGRHVSGGFVRDGNGYIVLANDAPKGTIIETPFGTGMVYDRGTSGNHIDVYVQ